MVETPMKRNTPYRTACGSSLRTDERNAEIRIKVWIPSCVTRCSATALGFLIIETTLFPSL